MKNCFIKTKTINYNNERSLIEVIRFTADGKLYYMIVLSKVVRVSDLKKYEDFSIRRKGDKYAFIFNRLVFVENTFEWLIEAMIKIKNI